MRRYTIAFAAILLVAFWFFSPVPHPDRPLTCSGLNAAVESQCSSNLWTRATAAGIGAALGLAIGSVADKLTKAA